jgi:2',3'-cyclic-nucleotide 2'-phosphodiesterase (5'-nucleotidase family)
MTEHEIGSFGMARVDEVERVRALASELRSEGAELVVLLSHLGLDDPGEPVDDRRLAPQLAGVVDVIVGAHSHDVLPDGEWSGPVLVTQAGEQAAYLGRIEIDGPERRASLIPVGDEIPLHAAVLAAAESAEADIEALLAEVVGELPSALDPESGAVWLAGIIRERMRADVAIVTPGIAFTRPLPGGPLTRGALADACESRANPGVVNLTGERLRAIVKYLLDRLPAKARGLERGVIHAAAELGLRAVDPRCVDERELIVSARYHAEQRVAGRLRQR